jgi:hypothetical protein
VAIAPEDGRSVPPEANGLKYFLEVEIAREAIDVWRNWRGGRVPSLDEKLEGVTYYAENDAWLPAE